MLLSPRWRKVLSDLVGNKTRTVLVVLSTALGIFAFGLFTGTRLLLIRELNAAYAATDPAEATLSGSAFDDDFVQAVRRMPEVGAAEGRRSLIVRVEVAPDQWKDLRLIAIRDYANIRVNKIDPLRGAWPPAKRAVLIEGTTITLLRAQIGDTLAIKTFAGQRREMRIDGLVHDFNASPTSRYEGPAQGYITLDTLEWLDQPRSATEIAIRVADARRASDKAYIQGIAEQIKARAEDNGTPVTQIIVPEPGKNLSTDTVVSVGLLLSVLGFFSLLLSGFLITNTLSAVLAQHIRQIGVMKAIGGRTGQIMGMYLGMVLVFGVLGVMIAIPFAAVAAQALSGYIAGLLNFSLVDSSIPPQLLGTEIAIGLIVPVVAATWPILSGTRMTVREAISSYGLGQGYQQLGLSDRLAERLRVLPRPLLLSLRNIFRRKGRLALTLTTLTLASALFMAVVSLRASMFATLYEQLLKSWNYDIEVSLSRPFSAHQLEHTALRVPGVARAEAWGTGTAQRVRADGSVSADITLVAPPAATEMLRPSAGLTQGRWLAPGDTNAIVVNVDLLANEPDVKIGDAIVLKIRNRETVWHVVGAFRRLRTSLQPVAYINYSYFARLAGESGTVSSVQIVTTQSDAAFTAQTARAIEEHYRHNGIAVSSIWLNKSIRGRVEYTLNVIAAVLFLLAILLAAVGALGLMGTMSLNVLERIREIGVMRAIGASDGAVLQIVIVEGIFIGVLSWAFGALLALPLSKLLSDALGVGMMRVPFDYTFSTQGVVLWLGIVIVLATLASFLPARNAARLTVRDVLAYE